MDTKGAMRIFAGVLVLVVGLPLLAYLALVVINWNDEPPSAEVEQLVAAYRDRPTLADDANGHVHMQRLGEGAADGLDPAQGLLARYRRMLVTDGWREDVPDDVGMPSPYYQPALEAQKLHLADARQQALAGDAAAVRELLEQDAAFWRRVMASSDLLITKMVAVAAVERNFESGNEVLRALPAELVDAAVPPSWRAPLTVAERSLVRAMGGEWQFISSALRTGLLAGDPATGPQGLFDRLAAPLFQEQATLNLQARSLARVVALSELPCDGLGPALEYLKHDRVEPRFRAYNPVGSVIGAFGPAPLYADYVARVSDVEGQRRATLLVANLRAAGIGPGDAAAAVREAALRSPYEDAAFEWDAAAGAVVFRGLAEGERGRYAVPL